jgi:hypothetical protein
MLDLSRAEHRATASATKEQPWVNGATGDIPTSSFHPTIDGYEQEAFRVPDEFGPLAR